MYVRNAWYVGAWAHDVEIGKPLGVSILGEPIVLWRSNGQPVAMQDRCVHRFAPLSLGRCEGANLRCMYHGIVFASDGRVIDIPGQKNIPRGAAVKTYRVTEKHSWVWVWMGDPDNADESLIPPAIGLDDQDFTFGHGTLDYRSEAKLINDNLLDFSHFSFVHEKSLGVGSAFADQPSKVKKLARGVHYRRWGVPPISHNASEATESWMEYEYNIPGILFNLSGNFPLGTGAACGFTKPDPELATYFSCSSQAVTPTGNGSARYFFSHGVHRRRSAGPSSDQMMAVITKAFEEDRVMIEAQQRVIDATPPAEILPTIHDRGAALFNRLVSSRLKGENQDERGRLKRESSKVKPIALLSSYL